MDQVNTMDVYQPITAETVVVLWLLNEYNEEYQRVRDAFSRRYAGVATKD